MSWFTSGSHRGRLAFTCGSVPRRNHAHDLEAFDRRLGSRTVGNLVLAWNMFQCPTGYLDYVVKVPSIAVPLSPRQLSITLQPSRIINSRLSRLIQVVKQLLRDEEP